MAEPARLRAMTWDHPRGFDPMVATSRAWAERHAGAEITWDRRSLQAFADRPIAEMAEEYDLMVIDHPHVGEVAASGLLVALDQLGRDEELATLARQSVGASHGSYRFDGHQWALAIDAATPVAAWRADRLDAAPTDWEAVIALARRGDVAMALIPINALMTFFGLARNLGAPVAEDPAHLVAPEIGARVLHEMRTLVALLDPRCLALDPIGVLDWMGNAADGPAYSPFGYGYTNYSRDGYCRYPVTFADAPGLDGNGPRGTVLGGTGIAVSARSRHRALAVDYAFWVASADCQAGPFFQAGGQPANAVAWESDACNAAARDFFRNTRATLESAWVRPRYDGYMGLQARGGDIVHACLRGDADIPATLAALDAAYRESRP